MKKAVVFVTIICLLVLCGCNQKPIEDTSGQGENKTENQSTTKTSFVSGSFTATVRDVIPDYVLDTWTPIVAVVTEYQSSPFLLRVGEEIGRQLQVGETYVFTMSFIATDYPKEVLEDVGTAALIAMLPQLRVTEFRLAEAGETALDSLQLTIE